MKLLGRTGASIGITIELKGTLTVGAGSGNDVRIAAEGVSRAHARIVPDPSGDAFWIEDLKSPNGTFVNGQRVMRERLSHLDVITLGRFVDLIVDGRGLAGGGPTREPAAAWLESLDDTQVRIAIVPGEFTLGRLLPANEVIERPEVSRLHARMRRVGDAIGIEDLRSANGTFVNGTRIIQETPLVNGDVVGIAGVRSYRLRSAAGTSGRLPVVEDQPAGTQEWKTRMVWSPEELADMDAAAFEPAGPRAAAAGPLVPPPPAPAAALAAPTPAAPASTTPESLVPPSPVPPIPVPPPAPMETRHEPRERPIKAPVLRAPSRESATAPASAPQLRGIRLRNASAEFFLAPGPHEVGREGGSLSVLLPVRQVSRQHATVTVTATGAALQDRGSANGTFVNGERVTISRALQNGDRVTFSDQEFAVTFVYE